VVESLVVREPQVYGIEFASVLVDRGEPQAVVLVGADGGAEVDPQPRRPLGRGVA
jgi:hypothetical protein